uniref:legumain n=2 Tax=Eptatretus burgeri TaxID=7764 RepID=A0A8C4R6H0_EPTBU
MFLKSIGVVSLILDIYYNSFSIPDVHLGPLRLMARVLLFVAVVVCSLLLLNGAHAAQEKNWVVIVAGSNGWYNYRHQADACHAYQIVHSHGIPDEQIVVMMYDDLANNTENPTPGVIINKPNGSNVYKGVLKDYVSDDVTPANFLAVLRGDAEAVRGKGNGKVIHSGPDDHVFVYFTDHGAPGLLAFPDDELHARLLNKTIAYMYHHKKYKKMVFYIEACESGSMMVHLPPDINVFSTTASNPHESSYACYYDEKRDTYLGDVYSVSWMEDSDQSISHMKIIEFQGNDTVPIGARQAVSHNTFRDAVPSPDVPFVILSRQLQKAQNESQARNIRKKLQALIEIRQLMELVVQKIAKMATYSEKQKIRVLNAQSLLSQHTCYEAVVVAFKRLCFNWNVPKVSWSSPDIITSYYPRQRDAIKNSHFASALAHEISDISVGKIQHSLQNRM